MIRTILGAASFLAVVGCSPVSVIAPVTDVHLRTSRALEANVATLTAVSTDAFVAFVRSETLDRMRDLVTASELEFADARGPTAAEKLKANAEALAAEAVGLTDDAASLLRRRAAGVQPLAHAVAFDGLSADVAAGIGAALDRIAGMSAGFTPEDRLRMKLAQVRLLPAAQRLEAGADVLIAAHDELTRAVRSQTAAVVKGAAALDNASRAGPDGAAFLRDVTSDDEVLGALASIIASRTSDPKRRAAAEALLADLQKNAAGSQE